MKSSLSISAASLGGVGSPAAKKFLFLGLAALLLAAAAAGGYWKFLKPASLVSAAAQKMVSSAPTFAKPVANAAPQAPLVAKAQEPVAIEVKVAPVASAPAPVSVEKAMAAPALPARPAAKKVIARTATGLPLAPQQKSDPLFRAGELAFYNLIDSAKVYPDAYGFMPDESLLDARMGEAIPVCQVAEADRANYQSGQPIKPLLKPADSWAFPVLIGDQVRCMVLVMRTGSKYVPGVGSKMLGHAWNKILAKWPAAEGYHPQLVVNPKLPGYYFTVPELAEQNLTDTTEMVFSSGHLSPAAVILSSWR